MRYFYKCFVFLFSLNLIQGRLFRCDYKYSSAAGGWFKAHNMPTTWDKARLRCLMEGAHLASPRNSEQAEEMLNIINNKIKRMVFTGINAYFTPIEFFALGDGFPLSEIKQGWHKKAKMHYNTFGERCIFLDTDGLIGYIHCSQSLPYICYRSGNVTTKTNECGTIDPEYYYYKLTEKCYKFHTIPRNYAGAILACVAEGGHLAIINSVKEHDFLKGLYTQYWNNGSILLDPSKKCYKDSAYIGFHSYGEKWDWRTIHGQTLSEAGYSKFKSDQPDNARGSQYCGTLHHDGGLNDYECDYKPARFLCEKDPKIPPLCEAPSIKQLKRRHKG